MELWYWISRNVLCCVEKSNKVIWKLPFCTHCNLLHTINNCYPIEFILEKQCTKFLHSCLSSDNLVISNVAKSSCDNCYSTFGDNVRYFSHKYNIASRFPRFLIDYSYFYTRIVISCDQRSVKRLNFQCNIKIITHF